MKTIDIYTDGACTGNPGPGGYGTILRYNGKEKTLSGGFRLTTNNRMELMAAIVGLQALKEPCIVNIYSDSRYLCDSISKGWAKRWQKNGWMRDKKNYALNHDLFKILLPLVDKHNATFIWVRGHNGHPQNERCDQMAVAAAAAKDLPADQLYENPPTIS